MLIGCLNVCGLKRRALYPDFSDLVRTFDIFCTVETKLNEMDVISLQGYNFINCPRKQTVIRRSGGIGVYIKSELASSITQTESNSDYVMWLKVEKSFLNTAQDVIIGVCYIPPQSSRFFNNDDLSTLEEEIMSVCTNYDLVYLMGDLNAQTAELSDYTVYDDTLDKYFDLDSDTIEYFDQESFFKDNGININRTSKDTKKNNTGYRIIDVCKNNNIFILNGRYGQDEGIGSFTFRKQSVIDYVITSRRGITILSDFEIQELDRIFSDGHSLLKISLEIPSSTSKVYSDKAPTNKSRKWEQRKSATFCENINEAEIHYIESYIDSLESGIILQQHIDEVTTKLTKLFNQAAEKTFTKEFCKPTNAKNENKPWFGFKCKKARMLYNRARKRYQDCKSDRNRTSLHNASKFYKQTMNKYINEHNRKLQAKLRKMQKSSPKDYWKYLNSVNKNKNEPNAPSVESFFDFFKNLNATESDDDTEDALKEELISNIDLDDDNQFLNSPITEEEISKCIKRLKNSKAPGSDLILNEYIKYTNPKMLNLYVKLFNLILETGVIPEKWVEGMIKPIYKNKGDPMNPENYRAITLVSCLGKLFTAVLNERINAFLSENEILSENQAGFRKFYSTSDHIFVLQSLFELQKLQNKKLYCTFIDFSKAFDSVWRIGLWNKLIKNEINGKFFRVIYNLYQNIKSCITLNDNNSTFFESYIGLRQGENLSPILFAIFLNDLEIYLDARHNKGIEFEYNDDEMYHFAQLLVLLYADDTVIMADSPENMQKCLNDFVAYCKIWRLNINYDKTKVLIFGTKATGSTKFMMDGNEIEIVTKYRYLGVEMSNNGSFLNARKGVCEKANKAMHLLYKRINNLNLPIDLQLKLFDSTILPIMTYGCEIWSYEDIKMFERIHNTFLRTITKTRKSTPLYCLYGELGRYPIEITMKVKTIGFWTRIVTGSQTKLVSLLYRKLYSYPDHEFNWVKNVKTILEEAGRNDFWLNQNVNMTKHVSKIIKGILIDQFKQKWSESMSESSKGLNYRMIKNEHCLENYLTILPKNKYIPLIKYRTANHFLPIETLRWGKQRVEVSERNCPLCDKSDPADEFHYLFVCKAFEEQRKLYLKPYYYLRPNTLKYNELFKTNSPQKLSKLSIFVSYIMNSFKRN